MIDLGVRSDLDLDLHKTIDASCRVISESAERTERGDEHRAPSWHELMSKWGYATVEPVDPEPVDLEEPDPAALPPHMSSSDDDWGGEGRGLLQRGAKGAGEAEGTQPSLDELLDEVGLGRWNLLVVWICGLGNAADAVEAMCMGYILPELPDVDVAQKGFLTAAIFIGMLFGGLFCGVIADRYGRRPCLLLSLGITAAFGLLSATMPSWTGVAFCRVAAGFGVGGGDTR